MEEKTPLAEIINFMGFEIPKVEIPYILTKEEENKHIENKLMSLEDYWRWKMKDRGETPNMINEKIQQMDFMTLFDKEVYLKEMNDLKYWKLEDEKFKAEKIVKEQQEHIDLKKRCNYEYMFRLLKRNSLEMFGKDFVLNNDNTPYIKALCFFLSEDKRFETELGYSFKKGLMIRGKYGIGKTHAIRCLANNELRPIAMHSMIEIYDAVKESGEYVAGYNFEGKVFIDDVGTEEEPVINYYGTKINWFKTFIEKADLNIQKHNKIIITTNNSFDELEQKYGGRARSRMAGMFNVIDVAGKDFRKL